MQAGRCVQVGDYRLGEDPVGKDGGVAVLVELAFDIRVHNGLAVGVADAGAGFVHHALDVARPFVGHGVVGVDRPAQLVALRAFGGKHFVVLLDAIGIFRDINPGRPFLKSLDTGLGFRIELIFGSRHTRPQQDQRGQPQEEYSKFIVHLHK